MSSIRGRLRTGLALGTLASFLVAGVVTDQVVRRTLLDDLDRSLRERGRLVASTVEFTPEGLDLGFVELEWHDSTATHGGSQLQIWHADGHELFRSPGLAVGVRPVALATGLERLTTERTSAGGSIRVFQARFIARIDPEFENPPAAPAVDMRMARDLDHVQALLARLRLLLIGVGLAGALLMLVVLRWVMRRSLRPLDELATGIAALHADALSRQLSLIDLPDELAPVVSRLNELLARLQAAFERERTFSADIAHELRTPLAGLRSSIEVELSRPREPDHYREALTDCLDISLQMQDMVQTLLQLARLDAGGAAEAAGDREPLDLAALVRSHLDPLMPRAQSRGLDVKVALPAGVTVTSDAALLGTALRNVLDNAVSHADTGGTVRVTVSTDAKAAQVAITNTGSRVAQPDVPRLFERFARGDRARSSDQGHHGLGLALTRRIAEVLGLSLEVSAGDGGEFVVTLRLPH